MLPFRYRAVVVALVVLFSATLASTSGYGYPPPAPRNPAPVVIDVTPRKTTVIVDGAEVGQARDFDSRAYPLWLKPGRHVLELAYKGHQTLRVKLEVKRGRAYRVHYVLRDGEGLDPRSLKAGQDPEGATETL